MKSYQERGELAVEASGRFGGAQLADQVVEGGEVDGEPGLAGGDGQGHGDHGFPDSWRSEERDVGLGADELQGGQVPDLAGVEVGLEADLRTMPT